MKILVCYKYVPCEDEIEINPDRTLNTAAASWVISPYDLKAIESGMQLASVQENTVLEVLTIGGDAVENSKMRKAVLSRGPSKMNAVHCGSCGDLYSTAVLLKQAIEKIGDVDLILFGEGSGDMYTQVLGTMVGALLGLPTINCVSQIHADGGLLTVTRVSGNTTETLSVTGPAVLSVTSDICQARIPSMKEILAAGKKPVEVRDSAEFTIEPSSVSTRSVLAPPRTERLQQIFPATEDGIQQFAQQLRKQL